MVCFLLECIYNLATVKSQQLMLVNQFKFLSTSEQIIYEVFFVWTYLSTYLRAVQQY